MKLFKKKKDLIATFNVTPPEPHFDRRGLAIVAIARGEARYLEEWFDFHFAAGVRHVFLYDDDLGRDKAAGRSQKTIAANYPDVTVIPWNMQFQTEAKERVSQQTLAYVHAIQNFGADFRWMTFIDIDEFLVPTRAKNFDEALRPLEHLRHILLPWQMFGRNGHEAPPARILPEYLQRARNITGTTGMNFKNLLDPCDTVRIAVHEASTLTHGDRGFNDRGEQYAKPRRNTDGLSWDNLALHHYFTRSNQELQEKLTRGQGLPITGDYKKRVMERVEIIERDTVEDRAALDAIARFSSL